MKKLLYLFLIFILHVSFSYSAITTIKESSLPLATTLSNTDYLRVVAGGDGANITYSAFKAQNKVYTDSLYTPYSTVLYQIGLLIPGAGDSVYYNGTAWETWDDGDPGKRMYDVSNHASLSACITALGTSDLIDLVIGVPISFSGTIPANYTLHFLKNGMLTVGASNIVITGKIAPTCNQIFDYTSTGVISMAGGTMSSLYPEWWGAVSGGTVDCTTAFQRAVDCAATITGASMQTGGGAEIKLTGSRYLLETTVYVTGHGIGFNGVAGRGTELRGKLYPTAEAGGTSDAITANFSPDVTLTDNKIVKITSDFSNAGTTPTFSSDGTTPKVITRTNGDPVAIGDIGPVGSIVLLKYNSAVPRWEILNPIHGDFIDVQASEIMFNVGDYIDLVRRTHITEFQNINFYSQEPANVGAAIRLYRTTSTRIHHCTFGHFNVAVDGIRASSMLMSHCRYSNSARAVQGLAFIRMQGLDESVLTGATYDTNGGGMHVSDCEFSGMAYPVENRIDTSSGILLKTIDGFYMTQSHFVGCVASVDIFPDATPANNTIADVLVANCYFDEPSHFTTPYNVWMHGSVKETITMASGATKRSFLKEMYFVNNKFRGGFVPYARNNVKIGIIDEDGWVDARNNFTDVVFTGNTFRQAERSSILVEGSQGGTIYVEVTGLIINGNSFADFNKGSSIEIGGAISIQPQSAVIVGNTFANYSGNPKVAWASGTSYTGNGSIVTGSDGNLYASIEPSTGEDPVSTTGFWQLLYSSDYIVWATLSYTSGRDLPNPSVTVSDNNFSKAIANVKYVGTTLAATGINQSTILSDNLFLGAGRVIKQQFKLTTTDATSTDIWTWAIPDGVAGFAQISVIGSNADGTKAVAYNFEAGFRNNGSASSLSSGSTSWTSVRAWNPDSIATIPTATLGTNTLKATVTGVAAETWSWTCSVELNACK